MIDTIKAGRILKVFSEKIKKDMYILVVYNYKAQYNKNYEVRCLVVYNDKIEISYEKEGVKENDGWRRSKTGKSYKYLEVEYKNIKDIIDESIKLDDNMLYYDNQGFAFIVILSLFRMKNLLKTM